MSKEDLIVMNGTVVEVLPNTIFKVELEEMNNVSTHGSSKNDPKRTYYLIGFE